MPSTFNVISLGNLADMDTVEGNMRAENAEALVGESFGGPGDALVNHVQSLSVGSDAYNDDGNTYYDMNGSSTNAFSIDGGSDQVFDGTAVFNATLTYVDGSTADISAVVFQDVDGNTYMAPEFSANADQAALEAKPIQSLTLNSLMGNRYSGMTGSHQSFDYVACFAEGTLITTDQRDVRVENLRVGDFLRTKDNGMQRVREITSQSNAGLGVWAPVRIAVGALGRGLPAAQLRVSQQHRLLVSSRVAERMTGEAEVLVAAKKLIGLPGINLAPLPETIRYFHVLMDQHEIIFANGAPAESLFPDAAKGARLAKDGQIGDDVSEIGLPGFARMVPKGQIQKGLVRRHLKNGRPLLQH